MKYIILSTAVSFLALQQGLIAQTALKVDCETGNRSADEASCWTFPNCKYSDAKVLSGKYSARTEYLLNNAANGARSPWVKFNGRHTISWNMKLDSWSGKASKFALLKEDASNISQMDTLYTYDFDQSNATTLKQASVDINATTVSRLHFYFYGDDGATRGIMDDLSIDADYYASPSNNCSPKALAKDTDGDGVPDADDAFPKDAARAYVTSLPASGPGTIMFEDTWPKIGDYDLNDLVIDYQMLATTNAANNVVDITFNITTRAIGGFYHNGLMLQFNGLAPEYIASVTGNDLGGAKWLDIAPNGTENGQKMANIVFFDDAYNIMSSPGGNFVNTILKNAYVKPVTATVVVTFNPKPGMEVALNSITPNPYLVLGQVRGNELHLADQLPSSKANTKLFGTGDDITNPAKGIYYRTKNNLPFGIAVNVSIPYMQEQVDFVKGYPNIAKWAESNGKAATDWYTDNPGNRHNDVLYIR